jgi:hypothetical protein
MSPGAAVARDEPAIGIVRDEDADGHRLEQRLHLFHALAQHLLGDFALREMIADLVLPLACAKRRARRADQRRDARRTLEHGDVAELLHRRGHALDAAPAARA